MTDEAKKTRVPLESGVSGPARIMAEAEAWDRYAAAAIGNSTGLHPVARTQYATSVADALLEERRKRFR
jgi:hypothetical protein